jgi:chromosome segregation ATPase
MDNPVIQTDLAEILKKLDSRFDKLDSRLDKISEDITEIKVSLAEVKGNIKAVDEKLSGKIEAVDEKLSGKIEALDTKVEQLDKRIGNQEFTNRGVLIGLIVVILGGAAKFFGLVGNP